MSMVDAEQANREAARPERILLVEDDEFSSQLIEMYLRKAGFAEVGIAKDGREALEMARTMAFDLMLLDLNLPRLNGAEVLRRLKKNEVLDRMAVLVISSMSNVEETAHCMEQGAEDFLPKPFNRILLENRVLSILERRRLRRIATRMEQVATRQAGLLRAADGVALELSAGTAGSVAGGLFKGAVPTGAMAHPVLLADGGTVLLMAESAEQEAELLPAPRLALLLGRRALAADAGAGPDRLIAAMEGGLQDQGIAATALRLAAVRIDRAADWLLYQATGGSSLLLVHAGAAGAQRLEAGEAPLADARSVVLVSQGLNGVAAMAPVRSALAAADGVDALLAALRQGATAAGHSALSHDAAALAVRLG